MFGDKETRMVEAGLLLAVPVSILVAVLLAGLSLA